MEACGREHADQNMLTGACQRDGVTGRVRRGVIICFVGYLQTRYLYEDGNVQTGACKREHVDGSMWMGVWGREYCDRSNFF